MIKNFDYFSTLKDKVWKDATEVVAFAWRRHRISLNVKQRELQRVEKEKIAEAWMLAK